MIAKASLALSVVALIVSVAAFATRGDKSSGDGCGAPEGKSTTVVRCAGNGAPSSSDGSCTPLSRESGVMLWMCERR